MKARIILILFFWSIATVGSLSGQEQGSIELKNIVEKEEIYVDDSGQSLKRRVSADTAIPGDELIYTIEFRNVGEEPAEAISILNPIPEHVLYRPGSAIGDNASVVFSVDGGQTFSPSEELEVVDATGMKRPASYEDYTHVKWNLQGELPPGGGGAVEFRVVLK